jgi:hypothetical protein
VTSGRFITTVRSIGSTTTAFVDSIEGARHFKLDHRSDRCEVEFCNGRRVAVSFHLFTVRELKDLFHPLFGIEWLRGLDIFHNRFMPDRRWNPLSVLHDERLTIQLAQFEETYATHPDFMERATHLLLVGCHESKSSGELLMESIFETASISPPASAALLERERMPVFLEDWPVISKTERRGIGCGRFRPEGVRSAPAGSDDGQGVGGRRGG